MRLSLGKNLPLETEFLWTIAFAEGGQSGDAEVHLIGLAVGLSCAMAEIKTCYNRLLASWYIVTCTHYVAKLGIKVLGRRRLETWTAVHTCNKQSLQESSKIQWVSSDHGLVVSSRGGWFLID